MKEVAEYIPLVAFLGKALGTHCEVVLHDVGNREHSIIACLLYTSPSPRD